MDYPLVSIVIPTKNSENFLEACLDSVKNQTYKNIEILIVDNNSTDNTKKIAGKYTDRVFNKGPERNTQRNFGAEKSQGYFLLFIDSDMELTSKVISSCINMINKDKSIRALIIPEKSKGNTFWAKCKILEKSLYVGDATKEAARFYNRTIYEKLGGYNQKLIVGEDYEMSDRVEKAGFRIGRIKEFIIHNEGNLKLKNTIRKKYYYGKNARRYLKEYSKEAQKHFNPLRLLSFKNWTRLARNPIYALGMFFMKFCEFTAGGMGYFVSLIRRGQNARKI